MKITCGDSSLAAKQSVRYLGCDLDQTLSGDSICKTVVHKSSSRLKFLYRQASCLNTVARKQLVSALVLCHFDYACSAWFHGLTQKSKLKLQVCQNKLIRFVLDLPPRAHIGSQEFRRVGWLPVEKRVDQIGLVHIFKMLHGQSPSYLSSDLTPVSSIHAYNTRFSQHSLVVPRTNGVGQKSFKYNGIKRWNSLPPTIQSLESLASFKRAVTKLSFNSLE